MKKLPVIICVIFLGLVLGVTSGVNAETDCNGKNGQDLYDCLGKQIDELGKSLEMSKAATTPLEQQVKQLDGRVKTIQAQINAAVVKQSTLLFSLLVWFFSLICLVLLSNIWVAVVTRASSNLLHQV